MSSAPPPLSPPLPPPLPNTEPRRRPLILVAIACSALFFALLKIRGLFDAFSNLLENGMIASLGTIGVNLAAILFSAMTLRTIFNDRLDSAKPLRNYLWCMLLFPAFVVLLRMLGVYNPYRPLPPDLLFFGMLADLGHLLVPITLLIWMVGSRRLKAYAASRPPASASQGGR